MKIKFIEAPKGREYKVGDVVDFKGPVEETYARKYINRGWAEPFDEAAGKLKAKLEVEAKARAEEDARVAAENKAYADQKKAEAEAKAQK